MNMADQLKTVAIDKLKKLKKDEEEKKLKLQEEERLAKLEKEKKLKDKFEEGEVSGSLILTRLEEVAGEGKLGTYWTYCNGRYSDESKAYQAGYLSKAEPILKEGGFKYEFYYDREKKYDSWGWETKCGEDYHEETREYWDDICCVKVSW